MTGFGHLIIFIFRRERILCNEQKMFMEMVPQVRVGLPKFGSGKEGSSWPACVDTNQFLKW